MEIILFTNIFEVQHFHQEHNSFDESKRSGLILGYDRARGEGGFALDPWRMLSGLGLGAFPGR